MMMTAEDIELKILDLHSLQSVWTSVDLSNSSDSSDGMTGRVRPSFLDFLVFGLRHCSKVMQSHAESMNSSD